MKTELSIYRDIFTAYKVLYETRQDDGKFNKFAYIYINLNRVIRRAQSILSADLVRHMQIRAMGKSNPPVFDGVVFGDIDFDNLLF